jgi:PAS domain S-box-containing protein
VRKSSQFRGLREFTEATTEAIIEFDSDGHIEGLNGATEKLFGYKPEELLGQLTSILIPEHFPLYLSDPERESAPPKEPMLALEGKRKDGTRFPVEIRFSLVTSRDDVRALVMIRDLSARKQIEDQLHAIRMDYIEQLRALAGRLQDAREDERRRISREVHDELGQGLTAIKIELSRLAQEVPKERKEWFETSKLLGQLIDRTIGSMRRIVTELRPRILDDLGLVAAVEWAAEEFEARTGTKCRLDLPESGRDVEPEQATALFRIFQESLTNIARHANATHVNVSLRKKNGTLSMEIHDDGKGATEEELAGNRSLGVLGMKERAFMLGGEFSIRGIPGRGTTIKVRFPVADAAEGRREAND